MGTKGNVYGEGNYEATRQYNESTKKFIEAGKVEQAARDAKRAIAQQPPQTSSCGFADELDVQIRELHSTGPCGFPMTLDPLQGRGTC